MPTRCSWLLSELQTFPKIHRKRTQGSCSTSTFVIEDHFEQRGMDIIGEINAYSSKQHKYILTSTNYFPHWTKEVPLTKLNDEVVINFIEQHIMTRFEVPKHFSFNNETYLSLLKLVEFSLEKEITLKYAVNYYPQGNGLTKYTNRNMIHILK
jgi:hypothetical protein